MAEIKGTLTANVIIDASVKELFMALAKEFEIDGLFQDWNREYVSAELEMVDGVEIPCIARYRDTSYHGSPHYERVSRREISMKQYQIAQCLSQLHTMIG